MVASRPSCHNHSTAAKPASLVDAIGIRLRDLTGPDNMMRDNMMWGSELGVSAQRVDFPQSRKNLAEIRAGVPDALCW